MATSTRSADYWSLTKPEVNLLIGLTTAAGFCLGRSQGLDGLPFVRLVHTVVGTLLVASGTGTLNQVLERPFDALMRRTAKRPVAAGRIPPSYALATGRFAVLRISASKRHSRNWFSVPVPLATSKVPTTV